MGEGFDILYIIILVQFLFLKIGEELINLHLRSKSKLLHPLFLNSIYLKWIVRSE